MIEDTATATANVIVTLGESTGAWLDAHLVNIIVIIILAAISRRVLTTVTVKLLSKTIRPDMYPSNTDRKKRLTTLNSLMTAIVKVGVWLVAGTMIISEIGVNTAPLLASAGIIGVALGFGAQSLVKDFVSGIFIILENQYRVGDVVMIADVTGTVEEVTIRTTVLRDLSGNVHHVPNGLIEVTTNKTIGYSSINEEIVVGFDADIERVEHIINHVGEEIAAMPEFAKITKEPIHFSSLKGYAVNGLIVGILGKATAGEQWGIRTEMYKRLKKAFEKAKIEITNIPTGAIMPPAKKK